MSRQKKRDRDYDKEYREYHAKPEQKKNRAARNTARAQAGLKRGDGKEVDHITALSNGGSKTSKSNRRVVSRTTNRRKGSK